MISRRAVLTAFFCSAMFGAAGAQAESYPSKPIRMVVASPPGGAVDVLGRLVGERMAHALGQPVVIENRAGAGNVIGARTVASAEADGYTLLFGSSASLAVAPALYRNAGYDPVKSFAPVALVSEGAQLLAVTPSLLVKSLPELVAYVKANPGKLNWGSGQGTSTHVAWGVFKQQTGTDIVYVPYQGAGPAILDLVAGRLHVIIESPGLLLGHVQEGKLRPLAVTSRERSADFPELPTMAESGYPDFVLTFWTGVVAPAGTPEPILQRLNTAINEGLRSPEMKQRLAQFQVEPRPGSTRDFATFIASEATKWAAAITTAGIAVE